MIAFGFDAAVALLIVVFVIGALLTLEWVVNQICGGGRTSGETTRPGPTSAAAALYDQDAQEQTACS